VVDVIVFLSVAFLVIFTVAWALRPDLRAWIEKPKYRFQGNVQGYDQARRDQARNAEGEAGKEKR